MHRPREPGGNQSPARLYLADAVHRRHQGIDPQAWVTPGSTEGSICPRGKVQGQLLALGVHAHVPGWERLCLWEVIRVGCTGPGGHRWGRVRCGRRDSYRLTALVGTFNMAAILKRKLRNTGMASQQDSVPSLPPSAHCQPPAHGCTLKQSWGCRSTFPRTYHC